MNDTIKVILGLIGGLAMLLTGHYFNILHNLERLADNGFDSRSDSGYAGRM